MNWTELLGLVKPTDTGQYTALPGGDNEYLNQWGERYYFDPEINKYVRSESNGGDAQWGEGSKEALAGLYTKYGLDPSMMTQGEELARPTEINGGLYVPVSKGYFDPNTGYDNFDPKIAAARAAALQNVYTDAEGNQWAKPQDVLTTNQMIAPYIPQKEDFLSKFGPLLVGGAVLGGGILGAGGLGAEAGAAALEGGSIGGIGGGAATGGVGLSADTLAWMQAAGYSPAEIASIGSQFGAGGVLSGITLDPSWNTVSNPFEGGASGGTQSTTVPTTPPISNPFEGATGDATGSTVPDQSALSRILSGAGTADDYLGLLGKVAPALLGAYTSNQQAGRLTDLANEYKGFGAPYRQRLGDLYANPQGFLNSPEVQVPVQQGTDMLARSLSIKGNPAGSGNALQQLQSYSSDQLFGKLGQEKDRLAGFGGLSNYNAAAPQLQSNAIGQQNQTYQAIGGGLANIFNPPQTWAQQASQLSDLMKTWGRT